MGEVEKNSFIALPGKGGHRELRPSKLSPPPPWRSFIVMVQRRLDQFRDFLLMGGWGGK